MDSWAWTWPVVRDWITWHLDKAREEIEFDAELGAVCDHVPSVAPQRAVERFAHRYHCGRRWKGERKQQKAFRRLMRMALRDCPFAVGEILKDLVMFLDQETLETLPGPERGQMARFSDRVRTWAAGLFCGNCGAYTKIRQPLFCSLCGEFWRPS